MGFAASAKLINSLDCDLPGLFKEGSPTPTSLQDVIG